MSSGKKKGGKGKTISLNAFLSNEAGQAPNYVKPTSWADEMENDDMPADDPSFSYNAPLIDRSALPTAPRAALGPQIDLSRVPKEGPFTAFLGNLPFDVNEDDIYMFFSKQKIVNVRLPDDRGRAKGFGYAEFEDRESLIDALSLHDEKLKNRQIRVDLAGSKQEGGEQRGGGGRDNRHDDGGEDRTLGDWRKKPAGNDDDRPQHSDYDRRDRYGDRDGRSGGSYGDRDGRGGGRYGDRDNRDRDGGGRWGSRGGGSRDGDYGRDRYDNRDGGRRFGGGGGYNRDSRDGGGRDDRDGGGYGRRDYGGPPRNRDSRDDVDREREAPKERPRLQLQPRSKPAEQEAPSERSSSIFGGAKPVDTARKEQEIAEKLAKSKVSEEKQEQPKKSSSSIFGSAKPVDTAAREREIEQRLMRERHEQSREEDRESRKRSEPPPPPVSNRRRSSEGSSDGQRERGISNSSDGRRERRISSSSSGKVAPPPVSGSTRVKRDSNTDEQEVFDDERGDKTAQSPPKKDESVKLVPAPPPSVNVWAKRKQSQEDQKVTPPRNTDPAGARRESGTEPETSPQPESRQSTQQRGTNPSHPVQQENTAPGGPPVKAESHSSGVSPPSTDNIWEKRRKEAKQVRPEDCVEVSIVTGEKTHPSGGGGSGEVKPFGRGGGSGAKPDGENAWTKRREAGPGNAGKSQPPAGRGGSNPWGRGGGRGGNPPMRGGGSTHSGVKPERTLPKSVEEMPKYEDSKSKDFSDSNKFSTLMAEEYDD